MKRLASLMGVLAGVAATSLAGASPPPGTSSLHSASPHVARTSQFARLPNWTGQWEIVGVTPNAAGQIYESLDEVLAPMKAWGPPPYRAEWLPLVHFVEDVLSKPTRGSRNCTFGFPTLMVHSPLMFEVLITPEETAMIFSGREIRHIYTDGRAHTPPDEIWPTFWGDSIGHWEGQTLVVDTISVVAPPEGKYPPGIITWSDTRDARLVALFSPSARYIERIRMLNPDLLEARITVHDPQAFTAPWTMVRQYQRVRGVNRMVHEDCEGEDRNPIVDGEGKLTPPPPEAPIPPIPPPPETKPTSQTKPLPHGPTDDSARRLAAETFRLCVDALDASAGSWLAMMIERTCSELDPSR